MGERIKELWKKEDWWAVWLGLGIVFMALSVYLTGGTIKGWAVTPGKWSTMSQLGDNLAKHGLAYLTIFLLFGIVFTISIAIMGRKIKEFIPGYTILFVGSLIIFYLASNTFVKGTLHLGAPLLALIIGLIIGNIKKMPEWLQTSLRTEYYIKTGIVLLGATLPLTLIFSAGPVAFIQATIVSVCTWLTIFLAATKIFKLDPRFGAVLGAGGAVCGVSASIAVGGAVKAKKDHIAIGIVRNTNLGRFICAEIEFTKKVPSSSSCLLINPYESCSILMMDFIRGVRGIIYPTDPPGIKAVFPPPR